jgi:hypothetical protein
MKSKLPFTTTNRTLAMALHFGGCRVVDIWREYPTEEAARADENPVTRYFLEDGENRAALEAAFDSVDECDKLDLPTVSDADAAKLVHLVLQFRTQIVEWLRNPASAKIIESKGEPSIEDDPRGGKVITHPGMKIRSLTATPTIIQHLRKQ